MFISYEYTECLECDKKTKENRYQYKIVDSDFEERVAADDQGGGGEYSVGVAVIDTYEKRNLPVAANLIKAFIWYSKKYGYTIDQIIRWNKQYNKKFAKYGQELEKYLIII